MSVARLLERGKTRDRLRLDRQRRHGGRLARGEGRRRRLRLLPQPPRGHEGARLHGARREGVPGRGQLRRSQPPLPRSGGSDGHGVRQHHAAPVLRRGRQDGGVRDRRAARLARARAHRHRRPPAARSPRACTRAWSSCSCSGSPRPTARASTSPSRAAATRSRARSSPRRPRSTPVMPETAAHSLAIGAPGDGYLVIDAVLKRGGTRRLRQRPGDLRGHRPAGGDRGPAHRARRRHHDRGAREARRGGHASARTRRSWRSSPATA